MIILQNNIKEHNLNWPQIPEHPYRKLPVASSGTGERNALLNLINHKPDIDKTYLYAKNSYKAKYQLIINKKESKDINYLNESKGFMIWMIFIKILKNTIQLINQKY